MLPPLVAPGENDAKVEGVPADGGAAAPAGVEEEAEGIREPSNGQSSCRPKRGREGGEDRAQKALEVRELQGGGCNRVAHLSLNH